VHGWTSPGAASEEFNTGIEIIEAAMGVAGPWRVVEMRYFTEPGILWLDGGVPAVRRWYVMAALVADPGFRARWLVEQRTSTIERVSAVATWDTTGFKSPDWTGFVGDGAPTAYLGLPGLWSGTPYDFVTATGDSVEPGLPAEVAGCLKGT
jgi:hypothetical protein